MPVINSNFGKGRNVTRSTSNISIDLTVTPPATSYSVAPVAAGTIYPGELLYLTSNHKASSLATSGSSNANAANCIGVAVGQYPLVAAQGFVGGVPAGDPNPATIDFAETGEYLFNTTAADTYNAYDVVYLGADARTIQKTASGTSVGIVCPDQRQTNQQGGVIYTPITGAAGVTIYIRIKPALAI